METQLIIKRKTTV